MKLESIINDAQVIAVLCNQYGDSGKGKFSDYFAEKWADVIARGTGGSNAGHTVEYNGRKIVFHLVPAGITQDANGKPTILGNGMVIDLNALIGELDELTKMGLSYDNLMISKDAQVTLPFHIKRDMEKNKSLSNGGIGSTGRGIGPTYTDKIARTGIAIEDLFDREESIKK